MEFDIRTTDTAYGFLLEFLQMRPDELMIEYLVNCEGDYEQFWNRNFSRIDQVDISDIRFIGFHITSNWDNCDEIRKQGLIDLQRVLSENTSLNRILRNYGIIFDIPQKTVYCGDHKINIDYDSLSKQDRHSFSDDELRVWNVAHRVYYDFLVNGFYNNDNIFGYGTDIHKRPEFFIQLTELFPQLCEYEKLWKQKSKSYKITFYAYLSQLAPYSFDMNNLDDPPYDDWADLTMEQRLKKRMLSLALDRVYDGLSEQYMYIRDGVGIPPSQIISYEEITE